MKTRINITGAAVALMAIGLASPAIAQTTHVIGTGSGTDFDTITLAIGSGSVVAGDTLLLDPANNGGNPFVQGAISIGVTVQGVNNPEVRGPGNWVINANTDVTISGVTVTGTEGLNGVVVNGDDTVLTIDNCIITGKPQWGVNVNTGTVNIINGTQITNNGWAGVSVGGGSATVVNITGDSSTPILISGNGALGDPTTPVQTAALSSRLLSDDTHTLTWNVTHAAISGSDYGYINQGSFQNPDESINPGNQVNETSIFTNVNFSDIGRSAIRLSGDNVDFTYNGGTITGRTTADGDIMDNLNIPLIDIRDSATGDGNVFTASDLEFPGGDVPARIRNDSNPITITNSVLTGGAQGLSVIYCGGGGATFTGCTFAPQGQAIMQGVGGTAPIILSDPVFSGSVPGIAFYMQGHTGELLIEGTDPEDKVNLDGVGGVVVFVRNYAGTTTFRNVTSTTNDALFDASGLNELAGPVVVNVEQSVFGGKGGRIDTRASSIPIPGAAVPSAHPVTINAINSIWAGGDYSPYAAVISVWDDENSVPSTVNLTHCTIAPTATAALLINGESGKDVIDSDYSIFNASGTGTLLASGVELEGTLNNIFSTGGATGNGGWAGGFPLDSINADPQLASNGELTSSSPAINQAVGSTTTVDYRGAVRPQGGGTDIGAHESGFTTVLDWLTF